MLPRRLLVVSGWWARSGGLWGRRRRLGRKEPSPEAPRHSSVCGPLNRAPCNNSAPLGVGAFSLLPPSRASLSNSHSGIVPLPVQPPSPPLRWGRAEATRRRRRRHSSSSQSGQPAPSAGGQAAEAADSTTGNRKQQRRQRQQHVCVNNKQQHAAQAAAAQ